MTASDGTSDAPYEALARRRRPQTFETLIGQEAMVRVLRNAFAAGRVHHAYVLTGVRGVGKTTTARIVARGLNCVGPDGRGGPTVAPCGVCDPCRRIAESRFVDVLEVDAASHTGVDFVRDLNEMVRYRPVEGRYKVVILDEAHMLSTAAFNALLKTLEEPPEHVKFLFATTEIQKMPATVLSRCQRFDLRRIEPETMLDFLKSVVSDEGARITDDALALVARAAAGSVRDALSLLDQALAQGAEDVDAARMRSLLGLADRSRALDLFEAVMRGDAAAALTELGAQYADGADPASALRELAEIAHWISVVKITPDAADDPTAPLAERERVRGLAAALPMRALSRAWQMLIKAIEETAIAPNAMMAAEMAIIRLTYVADLPGPEEILRRLSGDSPPSQPASPSGGGSAGSTRASLPNARLARPEATAAVAAAPAASPDPLARFATFESVIALIRERRDAKLLVSVESYVRLIRYAPGRIEFTPAPGAPSDLAGELTRRLSDWTGARWVVSVSAEDGAAPSITEQRRAEEDTLRARAASAPLVAAALTTFPGAEIKAVRPLPAPDATAAPPLDPGEADDDEVDDWSPLDPFAEE